MTFPHFTHFFTLVLKMHLTREAALTFWKFSQLSKQGSFGCYLGLRPIEIGGTVTIHEIGKNKSSVSYPVPKWLTNSNDGRLRLSSAIAVFDEISTYAGTMAWDAQTRPGVSISLSAHTVKPIDIGEGDLVYIDTIKRKSGKTIAFVDIEVKNKHGEVLIVGNHVKYMNMGFPLDYAFQKNIKKFSLAAFDKVLSMKSLPELPNPDSVDSVYEFSQLVPSKQRVDGLLKLDNRHANPIGSFHGGASVIALDSFTQKAQKALGLEVREPVSISTTLISGIPTQKPRDYPVCSEFSKDRNNNTIARAEILHRDAPAIDSLMIF